MSDNLQEKAKILKESAKESLGPGSTLILPEDFRELFAHLLLNPRSDSPPEEWEATTKAYKESPIAHMADYHHKKNHLLFFGATVVFSNKVDKPIWASGLLPMKGLLLH